MANDNEEFAQGGDANAEFEFFQKHFDIYRNVVFLSCSPGKSFPKRRVGEEFRCSILK